MMDDNGREQHYKSQVDNLLVMYCFKLFGIQLRRP